MTFIPVFNSNFREQEHAVARYDAWEKLRQRALTNAPGGKLPAGYVEIPHAPPPTPTPIDDGDIMDLSMELQAASIDDVPGDLDENGIERVPMADPGLDVGRSLCSR
jgi:serine/threonine-protein phosphatase 2A regulatory subunit B'